MRASSSSSFWSAGIASASNILCRSCSRAHSPLKIRSERSLHASDRFLISPSGPFVGSLTPFSSFRMNCVYVDS